MVIHGGFWKARYRKGLMDPLCADLVVQGWAAWNVEYRRVGFGGGGGGWPATGEDVAAAVEAVVALSARHPLDRRRVVTIGHSAGGHLALWAATLPGVTGAVGLAAVADLVEGARRGLGMGAVARFLGGGERSVGDRYAEASPAARLPLGVPQLLVHGELDTTVPPEMSMRYAERARAAGDEVELVIVPGIAHMEVIDPASAAWASVSAWLRGARS